MSLCFLSSIRHNKLLNKLTIRILKYSSTIFTKEETVIRQRKLITGDKLAKTLMKENSRIWWFIQNSFSLIVEIRSKTWVSDISFVTLVFSFFFQMSWRWDVFRFVGLVILESTKNKRNICFVENVIIYINSHAFFLQIGWKSVTSDY